MRVTVLGNSMGLVVAPDPQDPRARHSRTYAQHLEQLLADGSGPADVLNASRFGRTLTAAVMDWETAVLARRPDLVVVHHGVLEARPAVQPMAVLRSAYSWAHSDSVASRVSHTALRGAQRVLGPAGRALERSGTLPGHMGPQRFTRQLERLLRITALHLGVPVAVVDLPPATRFLAHESRGYAPRRALLQTALEQVVALHPDAYRVELAPLEQELGLDGVYGDGIHLTREAHARVARAVAEGWHRQRASAVTA